MGIGPRNWPDQFGLPGLDRAAKSSPGVGILMASLLIALASCSEERRVDSAPIKLQIATTETAVPSLTVRFMDEIIGRGDGIASGKSSVPYRGQKGRKTRGGQA